LAQRTQFKNMKNSTLSKLVILLAFGLLLLFGKNLLGRYEQQKPNEYLKLVKGIKKEDLVRIELSKGSQQLILTRQDGVWKAASKSADIAKVNELVSSLTPSDSPRLISENKEKFVDLELTQDLATNIKLISQKKELELMAGKKLSNETVVKVKDNDRVYGLVSVPNLVLDAYEWIDKTVVDIDGLQVKQLVYSGKDRYVLNQTADKQWSFEGSEEAVNNDGITTYLYKFNPFKADSLASEDQKKSFDLASNGFSVTLIDKGDNKTEMMFKLIDNNYVVKRISDSEYFVVSQSAGEGFEKQKSGFVAP